MPLAKRMKRSPHDVASAVMQKLAVDPRYAQICEPPTIAGPGFINMRLTRGALVKGLGNVLDATNADGSGDVVSRASAPKRVVVDYSSPNAAKEMHVGHLRSTLIGEALARVHEARGHDVLRLNHVGDWGLQFGMLIAHVESLGGGGGGSVCGQLELGQIYRDAKRSFDRRDASGETFRALCRQAVTRLQAGEGHALAIWEALCARSRADAGDIYAALGIEGLVERGESWYCACIPETLSDLQRRGLLVEVEDGALGVPMSRGTAADAATPDGDDGEARMMYVQRHDGASLYSTTDLAALRHRASAAGERADRVLYVTDAGQSGHFADVFDVARRAGFASDCVELVHVPFGVVQGVDGKRFRTREGDTVPLALLL
eukprot:g5669.t1